MHQFDLKNKTAVITGGAQGFGFDIAKKFLSSGSKVFIWDINEKELNSMNKHIPKAKTYLLFFSTALKRINSKSSTFRQHY